MLFTSAQLNLAENSEVCFWPFSADLRNGVFWSSRVQTVGQHEFQGPTATQKWGGGDSPELRSPEHSHAMFN